METKVTPQIMETQSQQVNEETPVIAQARVTKNPRKVSAGRKSALARKAKLIHISNIEHSRPIKTWAPYALGVVAIAAVWLFYKTGEEKTSPPIVQSQKQV